MTTKITSTAVVVSFVLSSVMTVSAVRAVDTYSGVSCQNKLQPQSRGALWNTGTVAWVECGVHITDNSGNDDDDLEVYYYDASTNMANAGDFLCTAMTTAMNGSDYEYTSATKYSCPIAGGCTFRVAGHSGVGTLRFDNVVRVGVDRVTLDCQVPPNSWFEGFTYSP